MLTIRLVRFGKKNHASFRVVVMDHKKAANAAPVEKLGFYDPHRKEDHFVIDTERAEYWLGQGAQVTTTVASFLKKAGITAPIKIRKKKTTKPRIKEESGTPAEEPKGVASNDASEKKEEAQKDEKPKEVVAQKEEKKDESSEEKQPEAKKEEKKDTPKEEKKEEKSK